MPMNREPETILHSAKVIIERKEVQELARQKLATAIATINSKPLYKIHKENDIMILQVKTTGGYEDVTIISEQELYDLVDYMNGNNL